MDLSGSGNASIGDVSTTLEESAPAKAGGKKAKTDSRSMTPLAYPVEVDHGRDSLLTDFGKDSYVLTSLGAALIVMALAFPLLHGAARGRLLRLAGHVEYLFFAVALPVAFAEIIKNVAGRGRPRS